MKKLVVTLVVCLCAAAARADIIAIPFSGSGSSGTIAPGLAWSINDGGTFSFGSPGVGESVLPWPGAPTPVDITDFTITFTRLPEGVTIDPASLATPGQDCGGGASGGTVFCSPGPGSEPFPGYTQWIPTLSNDDRTITFDAPAGISLTAGDDYFVNIFFTQSEGEAVNFTGGWSSPVPEPMSILLLGTVTVLCTLALRRRAARGM
ncbi:MAG TPA: PEP-CTERM sorting domain-containing protein [Bryobacteraceae bacterium]|nr:PEP-CTERM sorting domain-containing protein [Bryobacteraceae bacterium]HUA61868.1 PEP-CTERM sorting domain-containing protein [Verrucomicrobiae bacterium]